MAAFTEMCTEIVLFAASVLSKTEEGDNIHWEDNIYQWMWFPPLFSKFTEFF